MQHFTFLGSAPRCHKHDPKKYVERTVGAFVIDIKPVLVGAVGNTLACAVESLDIVLRLVRAGRAREGAATYAFLLVPIAAGGTDYGGHDCWSCEEQ